MLHRLRDIGGAMEERFTIGWSLMVLDALAPETNCASSTPPSLLTVCPDERLKLDFYMRRDRMERQRYLQPARLLTSDYYARICGLVAKSIY
jgi:hypothetical protein